jgi:hypothetical protein
MVILKFRKLNFEPKEMIDLIMLLSLDRLLSNNRLIDSRDLLMSFLILGWIPGLIRGNSSWKFESLIARSRTKWPTK